MDKDDVKLKSMLACEMLTAHALRKRRMRRMHLLNSTRSLIQTQNLLWAFNAQRRKMREQLFLSAFRYLAEANHVTVSPTHEDEVSEEDGISLLSITNKHSDSNFKERFRVTRKTFSHLVNLITPHFSSEESVEYVLAVALWRLGRTSDDSASDPIISVSKEDSIKYVLDVCNCITKTLMPNYIRVPTVDRFEPYLEKFERLTGLRNCIGTLCHSHVPLSTSLDLGGEYCNERGWPSVILQAVVGPDSQFWDINIGWPGRTPVDQVLTNSTLWSRGEGGDLFRKGKGSDDGDDELVIDTDDVLPPLQNDPVVLVGSVACPATEWLITPYIENEGSPERRKLNVAIANALNNAQGGLQQLRARFPMLLSHNDLTLETVPVIVAACCTLHNICQDNDDFWCEEWATKIAKFAPREPHIVSLDGFTLSVYAERVRDLVRRRMV